MAGERLFYDAAMLCDGAGLDLRQLRTAVARGTR
jgi:hypothetical protein